MATTAATNTTTTRIIKIYLYVNIIIMISTQVFPALYKYAKANLDPKSKIVISTSCNRDLKMCHHYIPMKDSEAFLLNHPDTDEYLKNLPKEAKTDFNVYFKGVKKLLGFK